MKPGAPRIGGTPSGVRGDLDEVEAIARIGSYTLDVRAGRWWSSPGLDAILGIDRAFERSVEGWASLIAPVDREATVTYLSEEVLGRGWPFDRQYRVVRSDTGAERWVHGRGVIELDPRGHPIRMRGTIADITDQRRAQEALVASEQRYAAIFEGTTEAILIADMGTRRFRWVNPAACTLFGYRREELLALTIEAIHPPEAQAAAAVQFQAIAAGRLRVARSVPCRHKDGSILLADIRGSQALIDGVPVNIGFFTDVTELRRHAIEDRKLAQAVEQTSEAVLFTGPTGEIEYVNAAFEDMTGIERGALVGGHTRGLASPQPKALFEAMWRTISVGGPWSGDLRHRRPDGTECVTEASISPVHDGDDGVAGYVVVERDVTAERALALERERLATAVEQTSDAVVIADLAGRIEYVNPAFERLSGYSRGEVVGVRQRDLWRRGHTSGFHQAMRRRLGRGQTWTGTLSSQRKDGTAYEEIVTVSPIRDPGGAITGSVAVKRDVTALRAAESGLAREFRERAEVAAALAHLQPRASAEETAGDLCEALIGFPGIDIAAIITFPNSGRAVTLAVRGLEGQPLRPRRPLPAGRGRYLAERAALGPWAEAWQTRSVDGRYGASMAAIGIRAVAYGPIRAGDELFGLVAVGTSDPDYAHHLIDHLPAVSEFAAAASALLPRQLERGQHDERIRRRIRDALAAGGLRTVFEPIVAIATGEPVGFEALTRFTDGTPPDQLIAEAHGVGLGAQVELACLAAAMVAAAQLDPACWVSLNVSPDVLLGSDELVGLAQGHVRQIVIELTEHAEIDDYAAVRQAIAGFGPNVSLAVDDAGAGFASLRHIVELVPRFLKLDASLVRNVDRDLARQAMIAGLRQFAGRVGCQVIAEGIETAAELVMLRELGVLLGQGYLFGQRATETPPGRTSKPRRST